MSIVSLHLTKVTLTHMTFYIICEKMVEKMAFSKHLHTAVHAVSSYTILLFQNCPPQFVLDIYKKQNKKEKLLPRQIFGHD